MAGRSLYDLVHLILENILIRHERSWHCRQCLEVAAFCPMSVGPLTFLKIWIRSKKHKSIINGQGNVFHDSPLCAPPFLFSSISLFLNKFWCNKKLWLCLTYYAWRFSFLGAYRCPKIALMCGLEQPDTRESLLCYTRIANAPLQYECQVLSCGSLKLCCFLAATKQIMPNFCWQIAV